MKQYSLWTAVITPLLHDGEIDFNSLSDVIGMQEKSKNGLLILGSTGEALNLSLEDRKRVLEHVLSLSPSSPIMVGVGGNLLEEQVEWIKYLETKKVSAYLMVTPHYAKPGDEGQYQWFKRLMDESSRACMLYNVPGRTGTPLSLGAVEKLRSHKNFWAIKEASGSAEEFKKYLKASGGKEVFCGDDALMPDFALLGASGLVSVASNAWPAETHLFVKQCLNRSFDAKELWAKASMSLFVASNPVPVKKLMHLKGMIRTSKMLPPLHHDDLQSTHEITMADEEVNRWFKGESK